MALSALVKISGVNNLSDARYCAGMGAAILGFCPEPGHPDYVDLKKFREITGWIQGVRLAGEFHNSSVDSILAVDGDFHFDFLQVDQPHLAEDLKGNGKAIIFQIDPGTFDSPVDVYKNLKNISGLVEYFLIEGQIPSKSWFDEICKYTKEFRILLGTGINRNNLPGIMSECSFSGFALRGSGEVKPGYLEPGELAEIMEMLEKDN